MNPSNAAYLEQNYHLWEQLKAQGTLKHVSQDIANNLLRIGREDFDPQYRENTTCGECILRMFKFVFGRYDQVRFPKSAIPGVIADAVAEGINQTKPRRRK